MPCGCDSLECMATWAVSQPREGSEEEGLDIEETKFELMAYVRIGFANKSWCILSRAFVVLVSKIQSQYGVPAAEIRAPDGAAHLCGELARSKLLSVRRGQRAYSI